MVLNASVYVPGLHDRETPAFCGQVKIWEFPKSQNLNFNFAKFQNLELTSQKFRIECGISQISDCCKVMISYGKQKERTYHLLVFLSFTSGWVQAHQGGREKEEVASTISKGSGRACYDACWADLYLRKCFVCAYKSMEKWITVPYWAMVSRFSLLEYCDEQKDPCTLTWWVGPGPRAAAYTLPTSRQARVDASRRWRLWLLHRWRRRLQLISPY